MKGFREMNKHSFYRFNRKFGNFEWVETDNNNQVTKVYIEPKNIYSQKDIEGLQTELEELNKDVKQWK